RRHTRSYGDWSSDVCSSDLTLGELPPPRLLQERFLPIPGNAPEGAWAVAARPTCSFPGPFTGLRSDRQVVPRPAGSPRFGREMRSEERRVGKGCAIWGWEDD